ncbi:NADPH-dependent FMN reductase [Streptomyces sp. NPDC085931]|uniref:NADPH-dependent FMN reductase n=1 Tax=Streptomyces sp. NPDC085931 TaxID=3365740 RepID=UPI0037D1ED07
MREEPETVSPSSTPSSPGTPPHLTAPPALKNALNRVYAKWNNTAVAFVSYGVNGGVHAAEALRPVAGALQLADVSAAVTLNPRTDFAACRSSPAPGHPWCRACAASSAGPYAPSRSWA